MNERDPIREEHDRRWQGLVCAHCNKPMARALGPLVAWDPDHVEDDDLALMPLPVATIPRDKGPAVWAVAVHPECARGQE